MDFANFSLTLLFSFVFGTLGFRLKLPAGALVGAVIGTVMFNLIFERAFFYADLRVVIQLVSGAMIGSRIGKKDFLSLRTIVLPTMFMLVGMIVFNLAFGTLMHQVGGLDVATALFSSAPGGMADMALISAELGAETAYVGILQMFRILVIILTMPPLFKKILQKRGYRGRHELVMVTSDVEEPAVLIASDEPAIPGGVVTSDERASSGKTVGIGASVVSEKPASSDGAMSRKLPVRLLILLGVAAVGGMLFRWLGITAGALTGGMLASAIYCILRGTVKFPNGLKFLLQIMAGAYIGIGIDRACVATMPNLLAPALIMAFGIYLFVFLMAWLMHRLFNLDMAVCLLSCTPGGVQEMSLLSEELGSDTAKIAVMQTIRLIFVILLFPTMLSIITRLSMG